MSHVFLSYAHADSADALSLYDDLSKAGYPVWIDQKALLVGQRWKVEITRAIRDASAFIALMTENSVDHRGYVQKELRQGLDVLEEIPPNQIYLLPVRLSDVRPVEDQLRDLHWLDLFPNRGESIAKLLDALSTIPDLPKHSQDDTQNLIPNDTETTPRLESMADVFRIILEYLPTSTPKSGANNSVRLTIRTSEEGVELPESLLRRYPKEITIVLEHQYSELVCEDDSFSVTLWFSGEETRIRVPYEAIAELRDPQADIRIA